MHTLLLLRTSGGWLGTLHPLPTQPTLIHVNSTSCMQACFAAKLLLPALMPRTYIRIRTPLLCFIKVVAAFLLSPKRPVAALPPPANHFQAAFSVIIGLHFFQMFLCAMSQVGTHSWGGWR